MQDPAVGGRADLRQTTAIDPNTGKPKQRLDLRPLKRGGSNDDIPKSGVIRVELAPLLPHPSDAVAFVDPSAGGLSKRLRALLVKDGALFGTCKVVVVLLEGKVTHGAGFFFQDGTIRVGINEDGDAFDLTEDNSNGETWLKERAAAIEPRVSTPSSNNSRGHRSHPASPRTEPGTARDALRDMAVVVPATPAPAIRCASRPTRRSGNAVTQELEQAPGTDSDRAANRATRAMNLLMLATPLG